MEQWKKENFNVHPVHENVSLGANGTKVLGLSWNTNEDYLTTDTKSLLEFVFLDKNTKRFILQAVGKIFDPLGLISPFTVKMKCLLQDLWKVEIQWDYPLPTHIEREWNKWYPHSWYHCAGKENPADFLSCGLSADCLVSNSRWWTGAEFLSDSEFPKNFQQVVPELDYLTEHEKENVVQERKKLPEADRTKYFVSENSDWKFIPPKSPHFGDLWEAGVKSVKHHLKRAIGNLHFTFEEFETIMIQVEGILNSRPLTLLSSDTDNFDVLTPGHFLIGRPITSIPEPNLIDVNENRLSRWEKITKVVQRTWKKWKSDYLNTLQARSKWITEKK
ncbi:integrase catalytic domain-containing protein [Trichonephila clavipes]|nr:integrase catalytic domain-containing protein [Trichonephila clavipes]